MSFIIAWLLSLVALILGLAVQTFGWAKVLAFAATIGYFALMVAVVIAFILMAKRLMWP